MLTDKHKQVILATVPLLREGGVALTKHFYNRMFTYHPELKNLFNMGNQNSGKQQTGVTTFRWTQKLSLHAVSLENEKE